MQRGAFLLHFGQVDQIFRELGQPARLPSDIRDPLVFPVQLGLQHVRVGPDDRDRRFQLVPGVRDEALLLFVALRDRTHDPPGKHQQEQKDRERAAERDADAGVQGIAEGRELPLAVEEDQHGFPVAGRAAIAVLVGKALFPPGGVHQLREGGGFFLAQRGEVVQIDAGETAVGEPRREKAGLVGQLSAAASLTGGTADSAVRRSLHVRRPILRPEHLSGKGAVVVRKDLQRFVGVGDQTAVAERVDRADQDEQHEEDRGERGGDELFPELSYHALASR